MRRFLFRLSVLVFALLACSGLPYIVLGAWNRVFGGWRSVFFCYAGSRGYAEAYAFPWAVPVFRWCPVPIGVFEQGGARGLVLAAPMTEEDFLDPAKAERFARFQRRLGRIARLLGVDRITLAGILPSTLGREAAIAFHDTRAATVAAVSRAVDRLVDDRFGGRAPPVILVGGAGHVGAVLAQALARRGYAVRVVDPAVGPAELPRDLRGCPALVVDVARRGAIAAYLDEMWPGLVLLNETFPEPPGALVRRIAARGVDVHHLAGVEGRVWPPLPLGYRGAVPCCAVHSDGAPGEVRIERLAAASRNAAQVTAERVR